MECGGVWGMSKKKQSKSYLPLGDCPQGAGMNLLQMICKAEGLRMKLCNEWHLSQCGRNRRVALDDLLYVDVS